jgi:hypothetical protein
MLIFSHSQVGKRIRVISRDWLNRYIVMQAHYVIYCKELGVIMFAKGMLSSLLPLLVMCYIGLPCRASTCGMIFNDYAVLTIVLANLT